ncbi:MAG TPA: hypothetical protein VNN79_05935 [Actinomycetota bacterium]|nr:hypothetical protein [Actinomycetota bacterium]
MGNYSLTAIFTKEPVVIAGAIRSILYVLILVGVVVLDDKQLAAIALALEVVLGLFARQGSTSTTSPNLTVGTPVNSGAAVVASVDPPPEPTAAAPAGGPA